MTDIKCRMCGRDNPSDLEFCQYCHARIKPLNSDLNDTEPIKTQQDLPHADLPSWLESLKPDSPEFDLDDHPVPVRNSIEGSGPLAGLQGVIPAEPDISYSHKPFGLSVKLKVSDNQQAHVALLDQIIQSESKATVISPKYVSGPGKLGRALLALLLVLLILLTLSMPRFIQVSSPNLVHFPSTWAAYQVVSSLVGDRPVLFAVDYQPGSSGEMDVVAGTVLRHLVSQNVKVMMVATHALGSLQTQKLMDQVSSETGKEYNYSENFINLGYIPGGHSGLLGFLSNPRKSMPFSVDGTFAWSQLAYQDVRSVNDFSLIVVATENTDTARNWIEQLTALKNSSPVVMAVSAQVEPVVAPYFAPSSGQVTGIISGYAGAVAYESATYYPGTAIQAYSPYSLAGLLAAAVIFIGSLYNAFSLLISEGPKKERNSGDGK